MSFTYFNFNYPIVCAVLGDLYTSTNGASWARKDGWADAAAGTAQRTSNVMNYCSFYGVSCLNGVVVSVCVRRAAWCNRYYCTTLRLSRRYVPPPSFLVARSNLQNNRLNGTIPASLGSLTTLQRLCVLCRLLRVSRFVRRS